MQTDFKNGERGVYPARLIQKEKKMKKTLRLMVASLMVGFLAGPQIAMQAFAAASGNYTDLLPIGAAGNTTVISNGSGWSLTTLPPTQTFGDSLSRLEIGRASCRERGWMWVVAV